MDIMNGMVEGVKSRYGYEETLQRIRERTEEIGWAVIGEHDLEEKVGVKVMIVEVCNKNLAGRILEKPEKRWISAFIPCHFSVVENPDGVYVYSMNMGAFAGALPEEIASVLREVAEADRRIVEAVL